MATIIDLGKLRFHFAGEWSSGTTYEINDIVKYGGNVYVYSNIARSNGNLPTDDAYWALMVEGFKFRSDWSSATQYRVGDGVAHGGVIYIAVADSQNQVPPNATYWSQFADGIQWEGEWVNTTAYQASDVVKYGAQAYIAKQDVPVGTLPTDTTYWETFVSGISAEGVYNSGTAYVPGDLVAYGANIYRCTANTTGNLPTDPAYFELFQTGNDYEGVWSSSTNYLIGQTVRYGGNVYKAKRDNSNAIPDISTLDWEVFTTGVNNRGNWTSTTEYHINDVVAHGGNTYIALISHTAGVFATDLAASKWQKFNSGVRYMGAWTSGTTYLKDDIVSESVSTYIATQDHTAGADFFIDFNTNNYWNNFVVGASYVLPATAGNAGKYLQTPDGTNYSWQFAGANDKVFYVAEDPTSSADDSDHGAAIDYAFASVRFACDYISADLANRTPATIFIKDGIYNEQLPIHVPAEVTIVGDGQRNCTIQPDTTTDIGFGAGISGDGTTPNNEQTMFFVNSGTMVVGLNLKGLTGFQLGSTTPTDPEDATIKGVYFRLEPGATITKSPYIKESSAFSSGGVGAIIDGSVVGSGNPGSMVFHTYTQVHDGGIGFWIKDKGLAEIVSCFTYYCDMGFVSSGGGKIRALNCNNSYGTYGTISTGYDSDEIPLNGYMYGDTLTYDPATLTTSEGFTVGDTITGPTKTGSRVVTDMSIASQAIITTKKDATVSAVTQANPGQVTTSAAHGFETGDSISFTGVGGMTELNGNSYTITVVNTTTFTIGADTTAFTAFTSGGTATLGGPHGLADGDMVSFSNVGEAAWQALLGDYAANDKRAWYADIQDSNSFKIATNYDLTNYFDTRSEAGWGFVIVNFTDATRSNPVRVTAPSHGFTSGDQMTEVKDVVGMTELNGNNYYVNVINANTLDLYTDAGLTSAVNGVSFGSYTSGGNGTRTLTGTSLTTCDFRVDDALDATIKNIQTNLTTNHRLVVSDQKRGLSGQTIKVNVGPPEYLGTGNRFYFNGQIDLAFNGYDERQYIFEQNDASNVGHPMYLATSKGATGGTDEFSTGVSYYLDGQPVANLAAYVSGFAAATAREVRFKIAAGQSGSQSSVYMCCHTHANMGNGQLYINAASGTAKERFIGNHPVFYPFSNGDSIDAQDSQGAVIAGNGNLGQFGFSLVLGGLKEEPRAGGSIQFTTGPAYDSDNSTYLTEPRLGVDARSYIITTVSGYDSSNDPRVGGTATLTLSQEKLNTEPAYYGQHFNIRYNYSQVRMTGHDFLSIGTGGKATTNYPGVPTQAASQGNEVTETLPGRVYYASTDQDGNFRVGNYFRIDQATGRATLDASAFDLSGLTSLRLGSIGAQLGENINEFSADGTLSGNSNSAVPTEQAVKTYVDAEITDVNAAIIAGPQKQLVTEVSGATNLTLGRVFAVNGAHTVTLPATAVAGDTIKVVDISGAASTANITVARNGHNIAGSANDLTIDVNNAGIELVYINATYGWGVL